MNEPSQKLLENSLKVVLTKIRDTIAAPGIGAAMSSPEARIAVCSGSSDMARGWPLQTTSRFGLACITKLLVSLVTAQLSAKGKISLDDPLINFLQPDHPVAGIIDKRITLRHLLTHTGGYQGPYIAGGAHRKINWNNPFGPLYKQVFQPGRVFNYENTGHVLLGEAIYGATGKSVLDHVKEQIFDPLGISVGNALKDYREPNTYVSPHRIDESNIKATAPIPFGPFWGPSLADMTLSLTDLCTIGEAIVGRRKETDFFWAPEIVADRFIELPSTVSGKAREHSPRYFNTLCAEYGEGWFGYAGSALGQTCGLRFNFRTKSVCAVAINAWLPIARDALMDRLCGSETHTNLGKAGGNFIPDLKELDGTYVGGGNIFREITVSVSNRSEVVLEFGDTGLVLPELRIHLDSATNLAPDPSAVIPGIGFFLEPDSRIPCLMVGLAALKKIN